MKFNVLAALCVASVMSVGGVLVSGEARADHHEEQTISGDSRSADAALSTKEAKKAAKKAAKKERKKAKRAAKAERAQKRKAAKQAKLAAAADAKGADAKVADAKGKGGKKKSGLICKREKSSGSHMRRKVCRTPEEMEERREKDQRLLRDINPAGGITPG